MMHERFIQTSLWCVPCDVILQAERATSERLTTLAKIRTPQSNSETSIIHLESVKQPCPICGFKLSIRGARVAAEHLKLDGHNCPVCGTKVAHRVPVIAPPPFVWEACIPERLLLFLQECNRLGLSPTGRNTILTESGSQWALPELVKLHPDAKIPDLDFRELEMKLVLYLETLKEPYGDAK